MNTINEIKTLLQSMNPQHLDIIDESHHHIAHHKNGGGHYSLTVVTDLFNNKSRIQRHRMVNEALASLFSEKIHALSIHTFTTTEYNAQL